jgi:hypothetical protein
VSPGNSWNDRITRRALSLTRFQMARLIGTRHRSKLYDWRLYAWRHQLELYWRHRSELYDWRHWSDRPPSAKRYSSKGPSVGGSCYAGHMSLVASLAIGKRPAAFFNGAEQRFDEPGFDPKHLRCLGVGKRVSAQCPVHHVDERIAEAVLPHGVVGRPALLLLVLFLLALLRRVPPCGVARAEVAVERRRDPAETVKPVGHHRLADAPLRGDRIDEGNDSVLVAGGEVRGSLRQCGGREQEFAGNIVADGCFRAVPAAVLRLPTCGQLRLQPLRHQFRIPCNED